MIPHTLTGLVPWIMLHGYTLFFIATVIEGALVTTAAGVVAGLGYFNIFAVIGISIAGDLVGDIAYYFIGRFSENIIHSKFFRFFGFHEERVEEMKKLLHTHTAKALLLIKLSPLIGPPGLISVGAVNVPFRKFLKMTVIISACKAVFFGLVGYFSAQSYVHISKAISHGQYLFIGLILFLVLVQVLYKKAAKRLTKKLEE